MEIKIGDVTAKTGRTDDESIWSLGIRTAPFALVAWGTGITPPRKHLVGLLQAFIDEGTPDWILGRSDTMNAENEALKQQLQSERGIEMPKILTIKTSDGDGEAIRVDSDAPWEISVPHGASRFYGSKDELKVYLENMLGSDFEGLHEKVDIDWILDVLPQPTK